MNGVYLRLVSETIEGEQKKSNSNFAALYRTHAGRLREIRDTASDELEAFLSQELLRDLLLAQTSPDPEIRDGFDSYTGEPDTKLCSLDCDNLMGDAETHICITGVQCQLGEPCPWEGEPHVPRGRLTWRDMQVPNSPSNVGNGPLTSEEQEYGEYLRTSTLSLTEEDDNFRFYHQHQMETFDGWDELREFKEDHQEEYDLYYDAIREPVEAEPWDIPALKFQKLFPAVGRILDDAVEQHLQGGMGLTTLLAIFLPFENGVALGLERPSLARTDLLPLYERAETLRDKYQQWLVYLEEPQLWAYYGEILPLPDRRADWFEEDARHIEHWCNFLAQQERKGHASEEDWNAEMAYREAACRGSPAEARRAARQVRRSHRENGYLVELDQYIQTCSRSR